jgi:ribosome-associated toxin RatA of RatAB toxin-antitoxin module
MRRLVALTAIAATVAWIAARAADPAPAPIPHEPKIKVDIAGDTIRVDVDFLVDAPRDAVWTVLTDFERMPRFVSNLKESKVLDRTPERVHLLQKGVASFGPITFAFESEREILLAPPDKIHSKLLRGNLKRYHGDTLLHAQGQRTRIEFHSEAATDAFIPPYFGRRFVENETREQYVEIAAEVARRRSTGAPGGTAAVPGAPPVVPAVSGAVPPAAPTPAPAATDVNAGPVQPVPAPRP